MKLKNVTLAAALLAVLTGCSSSGGGSNNSASNAEINNNQATQAQIEQQKAEVEKLKQQLYQAQNTQKQAEDKLKVTENSSKADVATAQKNLADAQAKLANIQQNLAQAEKNLAENKTNQASLQKQLSQAQQAVEQAKFAKENSEKVLNQQLKSKENDVAQAKKSLEDAKAQLSTAQENLNKLQNRLDNLPTNQKEFDKQFTQAQKALEDAKQAKLDAETNLNKQIADRNADLAKVQENLTVSNNKLAQAEKELKAAQASIQQSNSDKSLIETQLNQAKKDLEAAQKSKEEAEKTLKDQLVEKEQLLNTAQKEKNDAYDKLQAALEAKQKAEKALADKNALEQPLDKARTLEFALNGGLNNQDAQDFSERYKDKSKSELQDILNGWHKHIRLLDLARDQAGYFGFYDNESRETFAKEFAKENKDKTVDEAYEVLNEKLKQHNAELEKERLEHKKQVNALVDIAKAQGLSDSNAQNFANTFANNNQNLSQDEFKSQLQTKMTELVNQAKAVGLDENVANQFAKENVNNSGDSLEYNLNQLKVNLFTELANNSGLSQSNVYNLIHMNGNTLLSTDDFKKLIKASVLIMKGTENDYLGDYEVAFIKKYLSLSDAEIEAKIQKREDLNHLLNEYNTYGDGSFLNENIDKNRDEQLLAIADKIKGNGGKYPVNEISVTPMHVSKNSSSRQETNKKIYNQPYSIVQMNYRKETSDGYSLRSSEYVNVDTQGVNTKEHSFPTEGKATYTGKAFNYGNDGNLIYNVDFTARKGSGKITGFEQFGAITLKEAPIQVKQLSKDVGISGGSATTEKTVLKDTAWQTNGGLYSVNFYGPKAEEIGGRISLSGSLEHQAETNIGFGGTRGEIQK